MKSQDSDEKDVIQHRGADVSDSDHPGLWSKSEQQWKPGLRRGFDGFAKFKFDKYRGLNASQQSSFRVCPGSDYDFAKFDFTVDLNHSGTSSERCLPGSSGECRGFLRCSEHQKHRVVRHG